jgi:hypothetical protein
MVIHVIARPPLRRRREALRRYFDVIAKACYTPASSPSFLLRLGRLGDREATRRYTCNAYVTEVLAPPSDSAQELLDVTP